MAIQQNSKGLAKRIQLENEHKADIKKQQQKSNETHFNKAAEQEVLGVYKRTVIDSFIGTFDENYGDNFDYRSLVNSLKFSIKQDKNGLHPDFLFENYNVKFKNKKTEEFELFNENSRQEFVSNNDIIEGNIDLRNSFNSHEEYEAYYNGELQYADIQQLDGQFIPTSDSKRYGEFNKINKIKGYTPTEESGKKATTESEKVWDKIKEKILSNVIKKFKL